MRTRLNGRGIQPKFRTDTLHLWTFNDVANPAVRDMAGALNLGQHGTVEVPELVPSTIGTRCRRFNRTATPTILSTADASADTPSMLLEWTVSAWVRLRTAPAGDAYVWAFSGHGNLETQVENMIASLGVDVNSNPFVEWENGTGANVRYTFVNHVVVPSRLAYLTLRKTSVGGGNSTVELLVNGRVLETSTNLADADGGTSANVMWAVGGRTQTATTSAVEIDADIACLNVIETLQPIAEIKEDFRRGRMLGFWTHVDLKVEATDANGLRRDLTDLGDIDFVENATVTGNVDNAVKTASLSLTREQEHRSLAYLRTDSKENLTDVDDVTSYDPLIELGREVEIFAARVPLGVLGRGADFQSMIKGDIDDVDWGGENVKVNFRDNGARLVTGFVEEEVLNPAIVSGAPPEKQPSYGATGGDLLPNVIQDILDDNDSDTGNNTVAGLTARTNAYPPVTLHVPTIPNWSLLPWRQKREPVMTAVRNLAGQIGWEAKYKYIQSDSPELSDWKFTLFDPERTRNDADTVLTEREVASVNRVAVDTAGIRNVVRIVYPSSEATVPTPVNPDPIIYTMRWGWNGLDGQGGRMPAFVELEHIDSVARYGRRFFELGEASSSQIDTITEATQFCLAIISDLHEPDVDKSVTTESLFEVEEGDVLDFEVIKELYTVKMKLADVGYTHSFGDKATSSFDVRGKPVVGFKRWLQLESRPGQGRAPVMDPRLALTDSEVGPRLRVIRQTTDNRQNFQGGKFIAQVNPNFQNWNAGTQNTPDGWEVGDGAVWGTDMREDASVLASGGHGIRFLTATGRIQSGLIQTDGINDVPYGIQITAQQPSGGSFDSAPVVALRWFDVDGAELSVAGSGLSAHLCSNEVGISNLAISGTTATVTTSAVHGLTSGDLVCIRPASVIAGNQAYREEKVECTVLTTTTFTYTSTGTGHATGTDVGPEGGGVTGTVLLRERNARLPGPSTVGQFYLDRVIAVEPPSDDARFLRIEISRDGPSEIVVDSINVYKGARETRLTPRAQVSAVLGGWRLVAFRGDNPRWSKGYDYGRNWVSQSPTGSANPIGNTQYLAREAQRVRVLAKASFLESGGSITGARVRVVRNETYDGFGVADGVGTVEIIGDDVGAGGPGVAAGTAIAEASGEVLLDDGDTLSLEYYVAGSATVLYGLTASESFLSVKQQDID